MLTDLRVEVAAATDIGPRRKTNADAYFIDESAGFLGVADGMGDTSRSRAIAQSALDAVAELFLDPWSLLPFAERSIGEAAERLWLGVMQANGRLYVPRCEDAKRVGTTFVGAVLCARRFCVAHAGDSRAYVLRAGTSHLVKLTRDDTVQAEALARGVPHAVAAELPDAHALTRAIGLRASMDLRPALYPWEIGDVLLLCSDGLSNKLPPEEMVAALREFDDLERAAHSLVVRSLMAGGLDNVTAVLARRAS